jgi:uncharacterized protein YkwD
VWDRLEKYGKWTGTVAENISFGVTSGEDFIIQLYIDDGVPKRGHRKNIIHPDLLATGIAYCKHKKYGGMLVAVYASNFYPNATGLAEVAARAGN